MDLRYSVVQLCIASMKDPEFSIDEENAYRGHHPRPAYGWHSLAIESWRHGRKIRCGAGSRNNRAKAQRRPTGPMHHRERSMQASIDGS